MFLYSLGLWKQGGSVFFVFLEALVIIASLCMMLNVPDSIDGPLIAFAGIGFILWSLFLFEGYSTLFFIIGLSGVGMGYALDTGSRQREIALTIGSGLIALFSYLEANWIFFWLNLLFAGLSGYCWLTMRRSGK